MDRGPFAEPFRNVAPWRTRSEHPDDPAENWTMVEVRPSKTDLWREDRGEPLPLIVSGFFAPQRQILLNTGEHSNLAYRP